MMIIDYSPGVIRTQNYQIIISGLNMGKCAATVPEFGGMIKKRDSGAPPH